jgi:hypothetical protein
VANDAQLDVSGCWIEKCRSSRGTVITVAKVRAGTATPMGLFVVHGGTARWVPAVDTDRIALIGVITGLISAVIASVALLRRPPWPDLSATSAAWPRR